jgi:hypothetical protein
VPASSRGGRVLDEVVPSRCVSAVVENQACIDSTDIVELQHEQLLGVSRYFVDGKMISMHAG